MAKRRLEANQPSAPGVAVPLPSHPQSWVHKIALKAARKARKPARGPKPSKARKPRTTNPRKTGAASRSLPKPPKDILDLQALKAEIDASLGADTKARRAERKLVRRLEQLRFWRENQDRARQKKRDRLRQKEIKASQALRDVAVDRKVSKARAKRDAERLVYMAQLRAKYGPEMIDAYQDLTVWAGRFGVKSYSVSPHEDGTIDGQIELPGVRSVEQMNERCGALLAELPPTVWLRVGWRFELVVGPTDYNAGKGSDEVRSRYDKERFANVQAYWQRAGNPAIHPHPAGKSTEQRLTAEGIILAMTAPEYGHKVLGAVITVHWSPGHGRPDRR